MSESTGSKSGGKTSMSLSLVTPGDAYKSPWLPVAREDCCTAPPPAAPVPAPVPAALPAATAAATRMCRESVSTVTVEFTGSKRKEDRNISPDGRAKHSALSWMSSE